MKILYIITQADGGGAQKYALTLAKHFKGTIAAGQEASKLFDDAKNLQLTTYNIQHLKRNIKPVDDILAIFEIRRLVKILKPDIVHLNSSKAGFLGSLACMFLKTKVVFTAHGFIFNEPMGLLKKSFYMALEKLASDFRDFIITVSDADKKSALEIGLIKPDKIQTIHNGIESINFLSRDQARKDLGLPIDKKIWVTIANDYPTKNLDAFLTFKPVSGTLIAIIGNAPLRKSTDEIKYLGPVKDAFKYLKGFDGLIIPSKKEGFPFVALEAMQAGLPVVANNVGGIKEALGESGILVNPDNPEALSDACSSIITDEQKQQDLSQKSLERSRMFTEEKMLEETKQIYEQVLQI